MNCGRVHRRAVLAVLALFWAGACSRVEVPDKPLAVFRSSEPEYYRRYYRRAESDAIQPGEELESGALARLEHQLREVSLQWATARQEELVLGRDSSFVFSYMGFEDVPKGIDFLTLPAVGRRGQVEGTWSRDGDRLRLTVQRIADRRLDKPVEWDARWSGREVVIHLAVEMGPLLGDMVLIQAK